MARSIAAAIVVSRKRCRSQKEWPMTMKTAKHLIAEAKAQIESLAPEEVAAELHHGEAVLVDLREPAERVEHGVIAGAVHAPRGMLEFYADPTSAYYRPEFDPARRTILFCETGGRSALAAGTLQELGFTKVAHLHGGLTAWKEAGFRVEPGS
jgi:rhodanese-related sulfurtransferase